MQKAASPKGVFDILPKDPSPEGAWRTSHLWHYVEETIHDLVKSYGYKEIRTPIFEQTDLFIRGVGDSSDIVTKEMYTFDDKGGRSLTLRPEGTAAVMRAFVEKGLDQQGKLHKFYYIGPMFRYERPQAGRYRQHHQFGVEAIGDPSAEQDVETIDLLCTLYRRLGLTDLTVMLNSVGDAKSRQDFKEALISFLQPKFSSLSPDSQVRFEKNILRILDSKDPRDRELLQGAPELGASLSDEAREHFDRVQLLLKQLKLPYILSPQLVRGLDYYTKTVFEVTSGALGAQNAIGGGGRYDGLAKQLGGAPLPSVGFATGIERIIQTLIAQRAPLPLAPCPDLFLIPIGPRAKQFSFDLLYQLRHLGVYVEADLQSKKVGKSIESADSIGAKYALVLGDDEITSKIGTLRNLKTREEFSISLDEWEKTLLKFVLG